MCCASHCDKQGDAESTEAGIMMTKEKFLFQNLRNFSSQEQSDIVLQKKFI